MKYDVSQIIAFGAKLDSSVRTCGLRLRHNRRRSYRVLHEGHIMDRRIPRQGSLRPDPGLCCNAFLRSGVSFRGASYGCPWLIYRLVPTLTGCAFDQPISELFIQFKGKHRPIAFLEGTPWNFTAEIFCN